jgi:hypothetical protein
MIHKSFDEMTGKGELETDKFVLEEHKIFLGPSTYLQMTPTVVVTESGEKVYWLVFLSYYLDWQFLSDDVMYVLVDGNRSQVQGIVTYSDTRDDGDEVMCVEVAQFQVDAAWLTSVADSSSAKVRVIGRDFEITTEIKAQMAELVAEAAAS